MRLRLLHYSDIENVYDDPDRAARLAGLLDSLRDDDAVVAGTGDNTAPGVLALVSEGRQSLDFFEAVAPDLETFGNHDFDFGPAAARGIVADSPQTWVSANVRDGDRPFAADEGAVETAVREVGDTRVGFFGVTDPHTPSINPAATDLTVTDPYAAAADAVAALRERGVDVVVALSHLGNGDEELAVEVDVDVVLGGHVHTERVERVEDTLLTRPGQGGDVVLEVAFGDDGRPTVTRHEIADAPRDDRVAAALRERMADAGLGEVVASVDDPIGRSESNVFRGESRIGNFVADAYRWATDADVGLQNSGGIRSGDPLADDVTVADLVSVVPFEEPVTVAELTGDELRETLAGAAGTNLGFGEPDWWHAHVSGVELVWDRSAREIESVTVGGDPLDADATYTLATTDYLFHTDHEFPTLDDHHRVATHDTQYEVLADYARETGIDPELEDRIVRNGVRAD